MGRILRQICGIATIFETSILLNTDTQKTSRGEPQDRVTFCALVLQALVIKGVDFAALRIIQDMVSRFIPTFAKWRKVNGQDDALPRSVNNATTRCDGEVA